MKVSEKVHLIRKEFYVTQEVKRYINIYLIVGKDCYLVDSGVADSESLIAEYLESIGRKLTDIKGVFLTHAHPDHAGAAAEIKKLTGCKIYAPHQEISWIEDIKKQFAERPIPNFSKLLSESVKVDQPLYDGDTIQLEDVITIKALSTPGHSHGSMSYVLNKEILFTGDAIPMKNDLPIFVDFKESIQSLERIGKLPEIKKCCPAWDEVYESEKLDEVLKNSREMLLKLKDAVRQVEKELEECSQEERYKEALKRADLLKYYGNPLVKKSLEACKRL